MSTKLMEVVDRVKREPGTRLLSLAHLLDEEALAASFHRLRKSAAVGVDGISVEQYGQALEANIQGLHERMKAGRYRHQPILRVQILKENGKMRPIGISTVEDKVVQGAVSRLLGAIYEEVFYDFSHGFRPGRRPHDAIRAVDKMMGPDAKEVSWILEADIVSFFDRIVRKELMAMLESRIADKSLLRLVGKCLHVGVLEGEEYHEPEDGTAQGSVLSPLLGNIYLHHVMDQWWAKEVQPRLRGKARLIRYADDFVIGFERKDEAELVLRVLHKRMAKFGLTLHPEKTRLLPFGRPPSTQKGGKGPSTFDFLGFTFMWKRSRKGSWMLGMKTRTARLQRAIQRVADWCRRHRHKPVKEQHAELVRKIAGHFAYFGVNGNTRSLGILVHEVARAWFKWLDRRSQRASLTWERFTSLLKDFPLPSPCVKVQVWGKGP